MVAITLDATVDKDRNLIIHLPDDMPTGRVEVTIRSVEAQTTTQPFLSRQEARAKLLAAGRLSTAWDDEEEFQPTMTDAEIWELGQTVQNARTAQDYIDEERGNY